MTPPRSPASAPSPLPGPSDLPDLTETPRRPLGALRFAEPTSPDPTTDQASDLPGPDDSPSLGDAMGDEPTEANAGPRSSSKGSSASVLSKAALRDAARKAVLIVGAAANQLLTRDELEESNGLYATDEEDAAAIGDPLASIAKRHGGIGDAGNPDLADALMALFGLAMYAVKQLQLRQQLKALRQLNAADAKVDVGEQG